jgi:transcriptional regulator with XRE-family HTH domain
VPRALLKSARVREVLLREHITQAQLADAIGVSATHLSQLLSGARGAGPLVRRHFLSSSLFAGLDARDLFSHEPPQERTHVPSPSHSAA